MKSQSKIWNMIKDFNLIKYEITNGTIESHKFRLVLDFDGIIVKGKTMTINELAKIVNNLAIEMREGFKRVDEKIDDVKHELKNEMNTRFDKIEQRLDEHDVILQQHSTIFERNNLK